MRFVGKGRFTSGRESWTSSRGGEKTDNPKKKKKENACRGKEWVAKRGAGTTIRIADGSKQWYRLEEGALVEAVWGLAKKERKAQEKSEVSVKGEGGQ